MKRRPRPRRLVHLLATGLGGLALLRAGIAGAQGDDPPALFGVPVGVQPVAAQQFPEGKPPTPRPIGAMPPTGKSPNRDIQLDESFLVIRIKTTAPEPAELFRLETEEDLRQRVAQETRQYVPTYRGTLFPELRARPEPRSSAPRLNTPLVETVEPYFVCHGRLYFDQPNFERYGWNFGLFQPLISAGLFYTDILRLPYDWAADPCRHYDCNAGLCLPGDPVPLIWNPFIVK